MAILSSHTLDSVTGDHAGGIRVELFRIETDGRRTAVFDTRMDDGGRLSQELVLDETHTANDYELVFHSGEYFANCDDQFGGRIVQVVVIRLQMNDPTARYHIPVMLAPNSYSVWWSAFP